MKLLHILPGFSPEMGGTLAFVKAWVKESEKKGDIATILALTGDDLKKENDGFPVVFLPSSNGTYRFSSALIPWLKENVSEFDFVVIHGIWQYHSWGAWQVLRDHSVPYFVFPHGMLDDWFRRTYPLKHFKKYLYWWFAEYRVLRDAKAVVFTSEDERLSSHKAFLPYRAQERVSTLGIEEPPLHEENQKEIFFQKYPSLKEKRIILFLGRLHPKKGCDLLIRAFGKTFKGHPKTVLVMAGPEGVPGYESELKEIANEVLGDVQNRILWVGLLQGEMKWGALRSAELFVLPSHQENFGMAVAESLACGTPVFISNRVNIWREIEQQNAGLVSEDTEEGTRDGFVQWHSFSSEEILNYRKNARALFEAQFKIQEAVQRLEGLIQNLK
ncbi:MAG: glycosyltransferase [Verrucomicrobiota bacterium]